MYARTIITNWFPGLVCKFSGKASGLSDHSSAGLTSFPRRWLKKERLVFRWHTSRWSHPMDIQPTCLPIPDKTQWSDDLPPFYFCYWALGEHLYQQGTDRRDVYHRWKTTQPNPTTGCLEFTPQLLKNQWLPWQNMGSVHRSSPRRHGRHRCVLLTWQLLQCLLIQCFGLLRNQNKSKG